LLRRGYLKGFLNVADVGIYYPHLNGRKRIIELEKLRIRGLLKLLPNLKWVLTKKGEELVKNNDKRMVR